MTVQARSRWHSQHLRVTFRLQVRMAAPRFAVDDKFDFMLTARQLHDDFKIACDVPGR